MRALVTGIAGFVGGYLAEYLLAQGYEVAGFSMEERWPEDLCHLDERVSLFTGNITDRAQLRTVLQDFPADELYHLAAVAAVPDSLRDPELTWRVNLDGTRRLYDTLLELGQRPRILFVGTGHVYGAVTADDIPITERCPLRPTNPYAASKAAADLLSYQYFVQHDLHIVRTRALNHTGPRQATTYVVPHFAMQIAEIEHGLREPVMRVGNLQPERDMMDVRDVVRAYHLAIQAGQPGEVYNVATGNAVSMGTLLDKLRSASAAEIQVTRAAELVRAHETPRVVGDASALIKATGWQPRIPLDQTLTDTLEYWRLSQATSKGRGGR